MLFPKKWRKEEGSRKRFSFKTATEKKTLGMRTLSTRSPSTVKTDGVLLLIKMLLPTP